MTSTLDRPPSGEGPRDGNERRPARRESRRTKGRQKPRRGALSILGKLFITIGILVGLYGIYELFITDVIAESDRTEVATQWRAE